MSLYVNDTPEEEQIQLRVMDEQVTLTRFTDYGFASDFLTPADGWSFTMADEDLPLRERNALKVGARVRLSINTIPVADGHIDSLEVSASKSSGQRWVVSGRDRLALALDSTADPGLQFKAGATLADVLRTVFAPFGWVDLDAHFDIDNSANRRASVGGGDRAVKTSKKGKPLKDYVLHTLKPYNHESVFHFASRVAQRFGLWIWCSSDGETLIVGKPDFTQDPSYQLRRTLDGTGNIEEGSVHWDGTDQPSIIMADSFGGGGEFGRGRFKAFAVNPYFGVDADGFVLDSVSEIIKKWPDATQVPLVTAPFVRRVSIMPPRPMYLHDDESKDREQIENYVRREMSLLMRKSLTADYTVDGHGQNTKGVFSAWDVDTVVDVQDDVAGLHERMYVLGVHFEKGRTTGTRTRLHLVRLNSIQF